MAAAVEEISYILPLVFRAYLGSSNSEGGQICRQKGGWSLKNSNNRRWPLYITCFPHLCTYLAHLYIYTWYLDWSRSDLTSGRLIFKAYKDSCSRGRIKSDLTLIWNSIYDQFGIAIDEEFWSYFGIVLKHSMLDYLKDKGLLCLLIWDRSSIFFLLYITLMFGLHFLTIHWTDFMNRILACTDFRTHRCIKSDPVKVRSA